MRDDPPEIRATAVGEAQRFKLKEETVKEWGLKINLTTVKQVD
jgi:hypothetical protein